MLRDWAVFALSVLFGTQATIGYANRIDGTTADKACLHLGSARDVTTAGQFFFNIDGVAFSTWVNADGDLVVYSDVIPQNETVSIADGKFGPTPRVMDLGYGKKGYLDSSIMGIMDDADRLRITSLPKTNAGNDRPSRLDATTTHSTLINRILNNQTLGRGSGDNTIQSRWTGTGAAYMKNSTCNSSNRNKSLEKHVFHACGNANALHWYPEGQSGFAVDFNGPNNRTGDGIHTNIFHDEYLQIGSILQLLLRFPRPEPKIQVTKTSDFAAKTANLGDEITYTYEIKNAGFTYIENISISDDHRSKGSFTNPNIETATVTTDANHTGDSVNTNSTNGIWDQLGPGDVLTVTTTYKVTEADIIAYGSE
jgi:uncharacterized repeat protein (TIGR01451 family)